MRAAEHCPVCILQAHGGDAIPGFAGWTIERFVAVTTPPAVEPWNYPAQLQPSPVGRAVARSILLFWRADWRFTITLAIVGGDDPDLLLQAGALRAFSSTLVLTCMY